MKRIITCSDGTWNKPGTLDRGIKVSTNVEKMFNNICSTGKDLKTGADVEQLKAYDNGVGTGYSISDKLLGGLMGAGIDKNIKDMYTFICLNYSPGDELYLFGFSRGAYTARSIGGFIRNCGILKPDMIHLVEKAYSLYRDRNDYSLPDSDLMKSWRRQHCVENVTPIMFIGVWDTVGSLGLPLPFNKGLNREKYRFHDCTLSCFVKNAFHALAIDEKRKLFEPTLWEKSKTVKQNSDHEQKMEQRWFSGVHSNIGGGYADSGLSDIALKWIMDKAAETGLCFHDPHKMPAVPKFDAELRNSMSLMYMPWKAKDREISITNSIYNQTIDESVFERYKILSGYRPANLPK
jgi:uncharacterized protein (DUF2235 family)